MGYDMYSFLTLNPMGMEDLMNNVLAHVIQFTTLVGDYNSLTDTGSPDPTNYLAVTNYYVSLATIVGKVVRYLTNFDPT